MTFRSLALSSIRGSWRSYSAFFFSSVFSVMIFYIYAAFLEHPDVVSGHIMAADKVRQGMVFCEYLIIIFSFLFVLYSNSAFLKTRQQEFGLFSLFGMTKAQLRKLVIYENAAIAVLAIIIGIGLGVLFSKLFFMSLGVLLGMEESISFAVPLKAISLTAGGFFILFMLISFWTALRVGRTEIIDLLKAARKPKDQLKFSPWLVAVAVIGLGAAYGMALSLNSNSHNILLLLILISVVIGTYFLFTQLSILLLRCVQRRKSVYYNRTNMLIFAQLGYRIRDNARILFTVSILSAVIMTAMGTVYILQISTKDGMLQNSPFSLAYMEVGLHSHEVIDPETLKKIVEDDGFQIVKEAKTVSIPLQSFSIKQSESSGRSYENEHGVIVPLSEYNNLASLTNNQEINLKKGEVALNLPYFMRLGNGKNSVTGIVNGNSIQSEISLVIKAKVMNWLGDNYFMFIMDDASYEQLKATVPEEKLIVMYGYELSRWEKTVETVAKLRSLVPDELHSKIDFVRVDNYEEMKESTALTLFIGMFISLLFFIASGSMIYFKLFTELQEDQAHFRSLNRIGVTKSEIRKIVVTQIGIVFFVPVVVGISHAMFAIQSLDNLLGSSNWMYSFYIIGIFIAMQTLYFLIASRSYLKNILRTDAA